MSNVRGERLQVLAAGGVALPPEARIWGFQSVALERLPRPRKTRRRERVFYGLNEPTGIRSSDTANADIMTESSASSPVVPPASGSNIASEEVLQDAMEALMQRTGGAELDVRSIPHVPTEHLL